MKPCVYWTTISFCLSVLLLISEPEQGGQCALCQSLCSINNSGNLSVVCPLEDSDWCQVLHCWKLVWKITYLPVLPLLSVSVVLFCFFGVPMKLASTSSCRESKLQPYWAVATRRCNKMQVEPDSLLSSGRRAWLVTTLLPTFQSVAVTDLCDTEYTAPPVLPQPACAEVNQDTLDRSSR